MARTLGYVNANSGDLIQVLYTSKEVWLEIEYGEFDEHILARAELTPEEAMELSYLLSQAAMQMDSE